MGTGLLSGKESENSRVLPGIGGDQPGSREYTKAHSLVSREPGIFTSGGVRDDLNAA